MADTADATADGYYNDDQLEDEELDLSFLDDDEPETPETKK